MSSGKYKWKQWDHQTLIRMYWIWNTDTTICWRRYGAVGTPTPCWWECRMGLPLWNSFAISYKTKHTLVIQSNSHILGYLPRWAENLHPQRNLHMKVYSGFMDNCQNLEATKKPNSRWTDKQILVCPYNEMLFRHLQKKKLSSHKMIENRSEYEKATYCMIPTIWHSGKGKTTEIEKKTGVARGWRREGLDEQEEHRGFLGQRNYYS